VQLVGLSLVYCSFLCPSAKLSYGAHVTISSDVGGWMSGVVGGQFLVFLIYTLSPFPPISPRVGESRPGFSRLSVRLEHCRAAGEEVSLIWAKSDQNAEREDVCVTDW
jgi:hypothetical protein